MSALCARLEQKSGKGCESCFDSIVNQCTTYIMYNEVFPVSEYTPSDCSEYILAWTIIYTFDTWSVYY